MKERVTTAQLYRELLEMRKALDDRFDGLQDQLNIHRSVNHKPPPSNTKVGGIAGAVALCVAVLASVARALGLG